jgi:HAD superfamily phosphoserine phosphatase-like hydrolase
MKQFDKLKWQNQEVNSFEEISLKNFKNLVIEPKVAFVTANDIEKDAVLKEMDIFPNVNAKYSISHEDHTYYVAQFGIYPIVMIKLGTMGTTDPDAALLSVYELLNVWKKIKAVIAVGVAMGMKQNKQDFGDVVISKRICNYNVTKLTDDKEIERSSQPIASLMLVNRFDNCNKWKFLRENGTPCKKHIGLVITGASLVDDPEFRNKLVKRFPDAIGNEMEASGIWAACEKMKKEWIIVKGICDWGVGKTDEYQELAAASAVSLCKQVLSNPSALEETIKGKGKGKSNTQTTRINSLKLYYYREEKGLSTDELSKLTKIPEHKIKSFESFNVSKRPFDKFSFPECTTNEIKKLENILRYGRKVLDVEDKTTDFMGYLLSFYYRKKLRRIYNDIKVIVFDFDGTLTLNQTKARSTWQRIWVKLGYTVNECMELHNQFTNKEFGHPEWCNITCEKFKSKGMTKNILKEVASEMILIPGCIPTLKKIKEQGLLLYITSGSIKEVIEEVLGHENISIFEDFESNKMTFDKNGKLAKIIGTEYDFEGKANYIKKIANDLKINPHEILFIGDDHNDVFVYTSGAVTLCVNPNDADSTNRKKWHNVIYDMQNLEEILKYINIGKC